MDFPIERITYPLPHGTILCKLVMRNNDCIRPRNVLTQPGAVYLSMRNQGAIAGCTACWKSSR